MDASGLVNILGRILIKSDAGSLETPMSQASDPQNAARKETAVSKLPKISAQVASAALAAQHQYRETRLALHLPVPDYREPPRHAPELDRSEDDAAALVLDRDGEFTWVKF